eukprot:scaffold2269_cov221-Pinguiococcus_pyrenoidosus.AAC.1
MQLRCKLRGYREASATELLKVGLGAWVGPRDRAAGDALGFEIHWHARPSRSGTAEESIAPPRNSKELRSASVAGWLDAEQVAPLHVLVRTLVAHQRHPGAQGARLRFRSGAFGRSLACVRSPRPLFLNPSILGISILSTSPRRLRFCDVAGV